MIVEGWRSEVRDLLAQVPDRAELDRLASHCFDTAAKADGQFAAVVNFLAHAAVEEWGWRKDDPSGPPSPETRPGSGVQETSEAGKRR